MALKPADSASIRPVSGWRSSLRRLAGRDGEETAESPPEDPRKQDLAGVDAADVAIIERALPHTMTSVMRMRALIDAVRYCVRADIPGDFAECGVWRGGSVLAMICTLQELGVNDRDIHLYDTFEGMTEPTEHDTSKIDGPALKEWREAEERGSRAYPEFFGAQAFNEDDVRRLVLGSGYPEERLHFVRGPVEETLPAAAPAQIGLLRLDTDWYESTKHEMEHLYPRLARGGVLLIDDYGHWEGARRAVDEYLAQSEEEILLTAVDYTGRIALRR